MTQKYNGRELEKMRKLYLIYIRAYLRLDKTFNEKIKTAFKTLDLFISESRNFGIYLHDTGKDKKEIDNLKKIFHKGLEDLAPSRDGTLDQIQTIFGIESSFKDFKQELFADRNVMRMVESEINRLDARFDDVKEDLLNFIERTQTRQNPIASSIKSGVRKTTKKGQSNVTGLQPSNLSPLKLQAEAINGNWQGSGENIDISDRVAGFSSNIYSFEVNVGITVNEDMAITIKGFMTSRDPRTNTIVHKNVWVDATGILIHRHATLTCTVSLPNEFSSYGVIAVRFYELNKCNLSMIAFRAGEEDRVFAWVELTKTKSTEHTQVAPKSHIKPRR